MSMTAWWLVSQVRWELPPPACCWRTNAAARALAKMHRKLLRATGPQWTGLSRWELGRNGSVMISAYAECSPELPRHFAITPQGDKNDNRIVNLLLMDVNGLSRTQWTRDRSQNISSNLLYFKVFPKTSAILGWNYEGLAAESGEHEHWL